MALRATPEDESLMNSDRKAPVTITTITFVDFAPVGLPIVVAGVAVPRFGRRASTAGFRPAR